MYSKTGSTFNTPMVATDLWWLVVPELANLEGFRPSLTNVSSVFTLLTSMLAEKEERSNEVAGLA